MYGAPNRYLMLYDHDLRQHVDSSDFEEPSVIPLAAPKKGNHSLVKLKKQRRRTRKQSLHQEQHSENKADLYIDCDEYPIKLSRLINNEKTRDIKATQSNYYNISEDNLKCTNKKAHTKMRAPDDQISKVRSKLSVMKQKLMPCLSNIFKRCNNASTPISGIQESRVGNNCVDNRCRHCSNCERRRMRKLYKSQNYAVQPVYAIEGNAHNTTATYNNRTKIPDTPIQNNNRKISKNQSCSCGSLSSSSESESQSAKERERKIRKFRQKFKAEILKYQHHQHYRNVQNQYPSKDQRYHVYTTPSHSRANFVTEFKEQLGETPSSTPSFWDFLFDKVNKRYQTEKVTMACQNDGNQRAPCYSGNCPYEQPKLTPKSECPVCSANNRPQLEPAYTCVCQDRAETITTGIQGNYPSPTPVSAPKQKEQKDKQKAEISCECLHTPESPRNLQKTPCPTANECQDYHDEIKASLGRKYNGEVICIHNPPCILINGCLNLPQQNDHTEPDLDLWPLTESKKRSIFNYHKKRSSYREQSCQYQLQVQQVCQQVQGSDCRAEKKIQSICHHDPPCEVVRACYKPKFDPHLRNSCIHVPMCKKVPECAIGKGEATPCDHRPRCPEIPLCSRNYVILTARETVGTQVRPEVQERGICRHVPPCVMIPKCLGRVCETYLPLNVVPECAHHPLCEKIPACCRKSAKEMVSVSSQYPNSCRIV